MVLHSSGASTGIGLGLAEQFLNAGSKVIVTGRTSKTLEEAQKKFPSLITRVSDAAVVSEREKLVAWATEAYPDLNILVPLAAK